MPHAVRIGRRHRLLRDLRLHVAHPLRVGRGRIALEVVSPTPRDGRCDRVEKLADYAAFGVAWYWLLDPQLRSLEILELDGQGRYLHVLGASSGTPEKIPGYEGLTLDLDALWAAIDARMTSRPHFTRTGSTSRSL